MKCNHTSAPKFRTIFVSTFLGNGLLFGFFLKLRFGNSLDQQLFVLFFFTVYFITTKTRSIGPSTHPKHPNVGVTIHPRPVR